MQLKKSKSSETYCSCVFDIITYYSESVFRRSHSLTCNAFRNHCVFPDQRQCGALANWGNVESMWDNVFTLNNFYFASDVCSPTQTSNIEVVHHISSPNARSQGTASVRKEWSSIFETSLPINSILTVSDTSLSNTLKLKQATKTAILIYASKRKP